MDKGKGKKTSSDEKPIKKRFSFRLMKKAGGTPPQPVFSVPSFYSTGLIPPDESHAPTQVVSEEWLDQDIVPKNYPNLSSERSWSDVQHWYQEHDEIREEVDSEDLTDSSVQENEPRYTPRPPTYDQDTREWYRFHEDIALSARPVQSPPTLESSQGQSMLSTANSKNAKAMAKGKGKAMKKSKPTALEPSVLEPSKPEQLVDELSKPEPSTSSAQGPLPIVIRSQTPSTQAYSDSSSPMIEDSSEGEDDVGWGCDTIEIVLEHIQRWVRARAPPKIGEVWISSIGKFNFSATPDDYAISRSSHQGKTRFW
nr:hypothetical protein Iba_chr08cCG8910 [Ipomoea batatas]